MEPETIEFLGKPYFLHESAGIFIPVTGMDWMGEDGWRYHLDSTIGRFMLGENIKEVESDLEIFFKAPVDEKPLPRIINHLREVGKTFWCDYVSLVPYTKEFMVAHIGRRDNENYLVVKPRFFLNKR